MIVMMPVLTMYDDDVGGGNGGGGQQNNTKRKFNYTLVLHGKILFSLFFSFTSFTHITACTQKKQKEIYPKSNKKSFDFTLLSNEEQPK